MVEVLLDPGQEAEGPATNKPVLAVLRKQASAGAKEFQEGVCVLLQAAKSVSPELVSEHLDHGFHRQASQFRAAIDHHADRFVFR